MIALRLLTPARAVSTSADRPGSGMCVLQDCPASGRSIVGQAFGRCDQKSGGRALRSLAGGARPLRPRRGVTCLSQFVAYSQLFGVRFRALIWFNNCSVGVGS